MLSLNITQKIKLTDDDSLNAALSSVATSFDDPNTIIETNFEDFSSGRKNKLDINEVLTLDATGFVARFVLIETRNYCDITFHQPEYKRTVGGVEETVPASEFTITSASRIVMQFGIFNKVEIVSKINNNPVRYLMLGQKDLQL